MFVNEGDIPLVHQDDEDYDDHNTPDTSRTETSFMEPDAQEKTTSTLQLIQKVKKIS